MDLSMIAYFQGIAIGAKYSLVFMVLPMCLWFMWCETTTLIAKLRSGPYADSASTVHIDPKAKR